MGHTQEEERRTCNWHLRHIASAKLPKAHSREHVLAIMSRISMHSLTTASWHFFPNTECSLGSLETGHTPNLNYAPIKTRCWDTSLTMPVSQLTAKWERLNDTEKGYISPYAQKSTWKYILTYSSAYSKREILRVLEENSASTSKSRNTVTPSCA